MATSLKDQTSYAEDDLLMLSALQHLLFCERQCALIDIEQVWVENLFTAEGRILHERVDGGGVEKRKDVKQAFSLPLRSLRLGLSGKADVVEFHRLDDGKWLPSPVEFKRGRQKWNDCDRVQLCAQALCLEEMLGASVPTGSPPTRGRGLKCLPFLLGSVFFHGRYVLMKYQGEA